MNVKVITRITDNLDYYFRYTAIGVSLLFASEQDRCLCSKII